MKKELKYFLNYYTVRQDRSKINGLIKVVMVFNMPRLIVGGLVQSGGLVRKIWDRGIKKLKKDKKKVESALILGFGCGDCAFRIQKYYPKAKITGVEIDEKIVEVAKSYFNLQKLQNLNLEVGDGVKFLSRTRDKYDLVVVDVYLGSKMPKTFKTEQFFRKVKKRLNKNGVMVINHLFYKQYKKQAEKLITVIEKEFKTIKLLRTASNLLIFAED